MDELNRRKAILYTHPTQAACCRAQVPDVPPTVIEFGTDTTRTFADIVFSGTAARCPNLRFIFSHAGGTLPFLTERLLKVSVVDPKLDARVPQGVIHELQRLYYDTAWASDPTAMASLLKLVTPQQVLFGSDFPYRAGEDHVRGLAGCGLAETDLRAIGGVDAERLMPLRRL